MKRKLPAEWLTRAFCACLLTLAIALPSPPLLAWSLPGLSPPQPTAPAGVSSHRTWHSRQLKRMDGSPVSAARTHNGAGASAAGASAALSGRTPPPRSLPLFSGSFQRVGVSYPYTMVGADPGRGPATVTIPVVIIPIRWVFPESTAADFGGTNVFDTSTDLVDGQTAIQGILRSPIFTPYPFQVGGVNVGKTQLADAYYRANFWSDFNTRAGNHIVLNPTVAPVQTLVVPLDQTYGFFDTGVGYYRPAYDPSWMGDQRDTLIAALGITPDVLPIFVTGPVEATEFEDAHGPRFSAPRSQTYILSKYEPLNEYGGESPDIAGLAHEVLEWMNDPYGANQVPGWPIGPVPLSTFCLDRILEVADPLEDDVSTATIPFVAGGYTYHLPDTVFVDWFTHAPGSRSAGGLYSFFGNASGPSPDCVGDTIFASTTFDVPGGLYTTLNGINDSGDLVGYYFTFGDSGYSYHAFARRDGVVRNMDQPGLAFVELSAINDAGEISGYYSDGTTLHGLIVTAGRLQTIDYPGAVYTVLSNINSLGDAVGEYLDSASSLHGFVYRAGTFKTVDVPGAAWTAVSGINDWGALTLVALDTSGNPTGSYVLSGGRFTAVNFPGDPNFPGDITGTSVAALDDFGRLIGDFTNQLPWQLTPNDAFALQPLAGYQRLPSAQLNGMNNRGQMVGARDTHGFIANMPVAGH